MNVTLLSHTPDPERVVAMAARQCYSPLGVTELGQNLSDEKVAELIKTATIGDASLFSFIETTGAGLLSLDRERLQYVVHDALKVKCDVVSRDEKERGERRKLNFGHTIGHAVEKVYGLTHGEAISIGMAFAGRLSAAHGLLPAADARRLEQVLAAFELPTGVRLDDAVMDALRKDKKRQGGMIHFVLLDAIGSAAVMPLTIDEIEDAVHDLC